MTVTYLKKAEKTASTGEDETRAIVAKDRTIPLGDPGLLADILLPKSSSKKKYARMNFFNITIKEGIG